MKDNMYIDTIYARFWKKADELAEKEAEQFSVKPYSERVLYCDQEGAHLKYDDLTRAQFKDKQRDGHIHNMMTMYQTLMENSVEVVEDATEAEKDKVKGESK